MTQTAYSIETLKRAFLPVPPLLRANNRPSRDAVERKRVTSQPLGLRDLIERPVGQDRSADTLRFAGAAARDGWRPENIRAVLLDPSEPISGHCLDQPDPERAADRAIEMALADLPVAEAVMIAPSSYTWVPAEEIPPLDWLLGHWLLREEVTFVVAPGGVGKTTFLVAAALSLVSGRNLLGKVLIDGPKRVWLWNLEDSVAMMTRSVAAAAALHGIMPGEIGDRLFLDTARDGSPLCTARKTRDGLEMQEPVHEALVAALREKQIDVLIVDPFVSSHEGNENDNGEMDRILKDWCKVAQEAGCAIILCHHTSKAGSAEVNTMSARGAVAMTAAARVVLVLNPMSVAEANKLGVDADERWRLIQVTLDKSNRAPLEKADWYRKASVPLGPGDYAGAVQLWSPPKAVNLLTPGVIAAIKDALRDKEGRESVQSPDWVGFVIAEAMGLERPDNGTTARGKVTRALAELLKQGHVEKVIGKDAKSKPVPVLRLAQGNSLPAQVGAESGGEVEKFKE